jgi:hypothetical protein
MHIIGREFSTPPSPHPSIRGLLLPPLPFPPALAIPHSLTTFPFLPLINSFLFLQIRIAHFASPLFLHSYKMPRGCTPSLRPPDFRIPLPSPVYPKSFVCHSYESCRGVVAFFPFWNSFPLSTHRHYSFEALCALFSSSGMCTPFRQSSLRPSGNSASLRYLFPQTFRR